MLDAHAELAALRARRAGARAYLQERAKAMDPKTLDPNHQALQVLPNIDKSAQVRHMGDFLGTSFFTKI